MTCGLIEEIEHTADWAIRVQACELPGLFEFAAKGMVNLIGQIREESNGGVAVSQAVTLQAADIETLLVMWLEEILYILETENLLPASTDVQLLSDSQLLATLQLLPVDDRWKEIKAVTYHDLKIQETSEGFEATIVFDV